MMSSARGYIERKRNKLKRELAYLDRKYDPNGEPQRRFNEDMDRIHRLKSEGMIDATEAYDFAEKAKTHLAIAQANREIHREIYTQARQARQARSREGCIWIWAMFVIIVGIIIGYNFMF